MNLNIEKLIGLREQLSSLIKDMRSYNRKRDRVASAATRKVNKLSADMHYDAVMLERTAHETHCRCVEAGLADPYPDDHYGDIVQSDGWHEMKFHMRRPAVDPKH